MLGIPDAKDLRQKRRELLEQEERIENTINDAIRDGLLKVTVVGPLLPKVVKELNDLHYVVKETIDRKNVVISWE